MFSIKKIAFFLLAYFLLLGSLATSIHPVLATRQDGTVPSPSNKNSLEPDAPACWELDVVVLIDQSGSMYLTEIKGHPHQPSDPDNYRYEAAKEVLARLLLSRQEECPKALHRFAALTFGDTVKEALTLVQIDIGYGMNREIWSQDYIASIDAAISDRTQNATDPAAALAAAQKLLTNAEKLPTPEGYATRRQVVILLTDGMPTDKSLNLNIPEYMCRLQTSLAAWQEPSIWIIALNAASPYLGTPACDGSLSQNFTAIAESHHGNLLVPEYGTNTIPLMMRDIVDTEFGRPGEKIYCNKPFPIPPYTQNSELTFFIDSTVVF